MASPLRSLVEDESRYRKCFQTFLDCSSDHQCSQDLIHKILPSILTSIGEGKTHLKVIGVGSGAGEMDLQMLSQLHLKYPAMTVDNQVVEPNSQQIQKYRDTVSQKPDLDYIKFSWNKMTACEFQEHWKANHMSEQADFIHMIQMLYYVKDPGATISFFRGLLSNRGKLLIIHVSGKWFEPGTSEVRLLKQQYVRREWVGKAVEDLRTPTEHLRDESSVSMVDIKGLLDSQAVSYQSGELPCHMDVTECFIEGDEQGELLLDFLTQVLHFSQMASAELKAGVLELLRHPDCSSETSGRIMFKYNIAALVVDPLP